MAQNTVQAANIRGLTPAIDAVNSSDTFVLSGRNYVFDSLGPKSAFGSRIVNANPFWSATIRRGFQVIRASDRIILCTNEALFELDQVTDQLIPRIVFEPFQDVSRWTHGYLSGVDFFCHRGVGIVYWDRRTGIIGLLNTPGVPSSPIAISVDSSRLGILDGKSLTWSAPSNGFNFVPQFGGAGAQQLLVSGEPIALTSYSKGFFAWTTQGVMRSEFAGGNEVYRHRAINTEYRPINSFCVAQLDDNTSVILDNRGLFSSTGESPVPFQPEFNEYLINELKDNDSLVGNNVRLEWDPFARRLYISRSFDYSGELYHQSFALYVPLGKWGSFDEPHYGIGYGYFLDESGVLRQFSGRGHRDVLTTDSTAHLYEKRRVYPPLVQRQRESVVLATGIRLSPLPESDNYILARPIHYNYSLSAPLAFTTQGLDSQIVVGLFRLQSDEFADQLIHVENVFVGSVVSRAVSTGDIDYTTIPPGVSDEDYMAGTGGEDFGLDPVSFVNFAIRDLASNDGHSIFNSQTLTLARFDKALRIFAGGVAGIWHSIEITASTPGQYYHLRQLQINGTPAGRLL